MRWGGPKKTGLRPVPHVGDYEDRFAFLPTRVSNGYWVWLTYYAVLVRSIVPPPNVESMELTLGKPDKALVDHVPQILHYHAEVIGLRGSLPRRPVPPPSRRVRDGASAPPPWIPPSDPEAMARSIPPRERERGLVFTPDDPEAPGRDYVVPGSMQER